MGGVIAEFLISPEDFALEETLETVGEDGIEIERVAAHEEAISPFVWIRYTDRPNVEDALDEDPTVDDYQLLATRDGELLYEMEWTDRINVLAELLDENGVLLDASGTEKGWRLRVLFPERDALSRTYDRCQDHGIDPTIERIYEVGDSEGAAGLTEAQLETIREAFERGYYEIPREASLEDLAGDLDISHQALSERLRRAHRMIVRDVLLTGAADAADRGEDPEEA